MDSVDYAENYIRIYHPKKFWAHGALYTVDEATARIAHLEAKNDEIGPSDGRVTEIDIIREKLDEYLKHREDLKWRIVREQNIANYNSQLLRLGTTPEPTDRTIVYIDSSGHRRHGRYITEQGYLRALIRIEEKRQDLIWAG